MTYFDLILLIIIAGFVWFGMWGGFIKTLGGLVGMLAGIIVSGLYYDEFAELFIDLGMQEMLANVLAFVITYLVISQLVKLVFALVQKIFDVVSFVPFLKSINRLGGAILGLIEGILFVGALLLILGRYPNITDDFVNTLKESKVTNPLEKISSIYKPLVPDSLKDIPSVIELGDEYETAKARYDQAKEITN